MPISPIPPEEPEVADLLTLCVKSTGQLEIDLTVPGIPCALDVATINNALALVGAVLCGVAELVDIQRAFGRWTKYDMGMLFYRCCHEELPPEQADMGWEQLTDVTRDMWRARAVNFMHGWLGEALTRTMLGEDDMPETPKMTDEERRVELDRLEAEKRQLDDRIKELKEGAGGGNTVEHMQG